MPVNILVKNKDCQNSLCYSTNNLKARSTSKPNSYNHEVWSDKCAPVAIERGNFRKSEGIGLQELAIKPLDEGKTCKYLGLACKN